MKKLLFIALLTLAMIAFAACEEEESEQEDAAGADDPAAEAETEEEEEADEEEQQDPAEEEQEADLDNYNVVTITAIFGPGEDEPELFALEGYDLSNSIDLYDDEGEYDHTPIFGDEKPDLEELNLQERFVVTDGGAPYEDIIENPDDYLRVDENDTVSVDAEVSSDQVATVTGGDVAADTLYLLDPLTTPPNTPVNLELFHVEDNVYVVVHWKYN
ncbi:hypothetical protein [Isachenkonia alkalipeptolytica]|uniref:Uncharacterized protein n=1 Tax=Isachenkonia alkalipeptolytica TaxID=2565777 RepID=A0AA43XMX0_9CLOT|nr:hypothetical protein [Isachenkonia alkalipeptolytica]NBG89512.1 hypothetical protein [Isachenkonia alkalipeptolytica]